MQIYLVKRKKIIHAGLKLKDAFMGDRVISVCNKTWCCEDKNSIGESASRNRKGVK